MGRRFWLLFAAYLTSSLGNWVYRLTLPLLVFHITGSALQTGAVYALTYAPHLLLLLPGGVLADRYPRQRLLVGGDVLAALISVSLALIAGTGSLGAIYAMAFLLACVNPLYHPAFQAVIPELVPSEKIAVANARIYGADNVLNLLGPVLAGALVVAAGHQTALFLDSVTFCVSALLLVFIGGTAVPERRREMIREGVTYLRGNRILLSGAFVFGAFNLFVCMMQFNLVYYLSEYEGFSPVLVGVMLGLEGLGLLIGASLAPRLLDRFRPGRLIAVGNGIMGLGILLLLPASGPVLIGLIWMVVFAGGGLSDIAIFTLRHKLVPSALLGRVVALTRMIAWSGMPLAALAGGGLESRFDDFSLVIALAGAGTLITALVSTRTALGRAPLMKDAPVKEVAAVA